MNIRSDYLEILRQQQQQNVSTTGKSVSDAFGKMFTDEMESQNPAVTGHAVPTPSAGIDPMLLGMVEAPQASSTVDETALQDLAGQAEELLGGWDTYAQTLLSGSNRDAWNQLAGMDASLKQLRSGLDQLESADKGGLEAVVNELEVLAATENFKFNRGDYL